MAVIRKVSFTLPARAVRGCALVVGVMIAGTLISCEKPREEVVSTESRGKTTKDKPVKLFASSDERFRNTPKSPYRAEVPSDWVMRPATQFRLLNYACGSSGRCEAYVSQSQGTVLDNVNRWLKQFSQSALDDAGLQGLKSVTCLGQSGVLVKAEGTYVGGMGKEPEADFALIGVVVALGDAIHTVKLVGPAAEVKAQEAQLLSFVKSLQMIE